MKTAILFTSLSSLLFLTACANQQLKVNQPSIDMSPVGCGYKWFQTGTSPELHRDCDIPRDELLRKSQETLAIEYAWEVAKERCPADCPPQELKDTSTWEEPFPDGVCRDDRVYYTARLFFQCTQ